MQSGGGGELRLIRSLSARLRVAESQLVEAQERHRVLSGELASWAADYERQVWEATAAVERAHEQGYVDAALDLAFRDRELRILRRQLRFLEGVLRHAQDGFLERTTVDEALGQLAAIAAEEPALDRAATRRKEAPP